MASPSAYKWRVFTPNREKTASRQRIRKKVTERGVEFALSHSKQVKGFLARAVQGKSGSQRKNFQRGLKIAHSLSIQVEGYFVRRRGNSI